MRPKLATVTDRV